MKKILILEANPPGTQWLRLDEEERQIREVTQIAQSQQEIEIISRGAIRVDDLQKLLLQYQPNIVHFCGHGHQENGLIVENESPQQQFVSSESLAELFKLSKNHVECVVLNACYSAVLAEAIFQHINCVIAMNNTVGDNAAIKFATGFYRALSNGKNYQDCFDFGCNSINLHGIPESQTPQIKIRDSSKIFKSELEELIDILNSDFNDYKNIILKAYNSSLSNERFINKYKVPQNSEQLVKYLEGFPCLDTYSYIDKFVGYLFLEQKLSLETIQKLKQWRDRNINHFDRLLHHLEEEQNRNKQECSGILMAIIQEGGSYIVKAWLNKNVAQSQQDSLSNWQQLSIEKQDAITDKNLTKLPSLLRNWIYNSGLDIKQIHIFLPYELMNHPVDSWKTDEDDDETIGEFYEVIIRCSQRMVGRGRQILRWKTKGEKINNTIQPTAIFKSYDHDNHKMIENDCKKDEVIAVQITNVFQEEQPGTILWKSAIPLALWIRTKLNSTDNKAVLQELIDNCSSVQDIPTQVKNKRLDIQTDIGRHLCLLWDDPNLLPPTQNLRDSKL